MLRAVHDVHALHSSSDTLLALLLRYAHVEQREFDVLIHVELVDEVEALEHETDDTLAESGALVLGELRYVSAVEPEAAFCRIVEQTEDVEQC